MLSWTRSLLSGGKDGARQDSVEAYSDENPPLPYQGPFNPDEYISLELVEEEMYNHNAKRQYRLTFALPDERPTNLPVASALFARSADPTAVVDDNGNPIIRWYTPISSPFLPGRIQFIIKRYEKGALSTHIHGLKIGDRLAFRGPIPKWSYRANQFKHVALLGGGSGITPLFQVLTHALRDPDNETLFTLIYGNNSEADILLREDLEDLKTRHPEHLDLVFVLDKPVDGWRGPTGYFDGEMMKKYLPAPKLGQKLKIFVCGPPAFLVSVAGGAFSFGPPTGALSDSGFSKYQVYTF